MPGWCENTINISGEKTKLMKLYNQFKKGEILNILCPVDIDVEGDNDDRYIEHWGTEWEIDITRFDSVIKYFENDEMGHIIINCYTANGPPIEALEFYSKQNDDIIILH